MLKGLYCENLEICEGNGARKEKTPQPEGAGVEIDAGVLHVCSQISQKDEFIDFLQFCCGLLHKGLQVPAIYSAYLDRQNEK